MALFGKLKPPPPEEPEEPKEPEATPQYVTREALDEALAPARALNETVGGLKTLIEGLGEKLGTPAPAAVTTAPAEITDQEIEEAVLAGKGPDVIRRLVDQRVASQVSPLTTFGLSNFGAIARQSLETQPFYKRFKQEIDDVVANMSPELQASPQALKMAHDTVVGSHWAEIADEMAEEKVRRAAEGESAGSVTPGDGTPGGGPKGSKKRPSVEEFAGTEGLSALKMIGPKGKTQDELAIGFGYESWDHMMADYEKLVADGEQTH